MSQNEQCFPHYWGHPERKELGVGSRQGNGTRTYRVLLQNSEIETND